MPGTTMRFLGCLCASPREGETDACQKSDALVYELYGLSEEEIAIEDGRDH